MTVMQICESYDISESMLYRWVHLFERRYGEWMEIITCGLDGKKRNEKKKDENCFVFFEIKSDRVFLQSEIKEIRSLKKDIVEIHTILYEKDLSWIRWQRPLGFPLKTTTGRWTMPDVPLKYLLSL